MNKYIYIFAFCFISLHLLADTTSVYGVHSPALFRKERKQSEQDADSIMKLVITQAKQYEKSLSSYEAEIYIKGRAEILRHNKLIRFANKLFPVSRRNKDFVFEMVSESKYEAPNIYFHDFQAINGSVIPNGKKQEEFMHFLNLNIYAPTAYNEGYLMPLAKSAFRFYKFDLIETGMVDGVRIHRIRFLPKQWNQKLVSGDLFIVDKTWTIDKVDLSGRYAFADFNVIMSFSRNYRRFILPETAYLQIRYDLLGNTVLSTYNAKFNHHSVEWIEENNLPRRKGLSLDLSNYFKLSSDTVPIITDSEFWEAKREIPLLPEEEQLYEASKAKHLVNTDTITDTPFIQLTEKLTNTMRFDNNSLRVRYSGILNPFQLGYSKRNGVSYKQKIRFTKTFEDQTQLVFTPEVGYLFKQKEWFFKVNTDWHYLPEKMGRLRLSVGNDNKLFSSSVMKDIDQMLKDSTFSFDDLNIRYFRNYFVEIKNDIELLNGLKVSAGLSYYRRLPVKDKNEIKDDQDDEISDAIHERYNDFFPSVKLTYTPRQFYRMDGRRKEYIFSYFPTTSIEIGRGIPGVLGSTGNYTRLEGNIHQSIPISMLRRFNYNLSAGMYTMHKTTYFADFSYFRRRAFPESWSDQLGGVFNQLNRDWFNASDKYIQGHFMYQSPFMLFQFINSKKTSRHILSERFYLGAVSTPVLKCYTEAGYGIGNHIFNVAMFAGFNKGNFDSIGFKFAFELFQ